MVVQGASPVPPRLSVVRSNASQLLTVRQVADELGVSTATVYALVDRGELAHVRVSNAIRIAPATLAGFVATRTRTVAQGD